MALDLNMFYSCTVDERMAIVSEGGEYITRIKYGEYYIHLYLVEGDLVEVYYTIAANRREDVEVLDSNDVRLNLYMVSVDLSDLYRTK